MSDERDERLKEILEEFKERIIGTKWPSEDDCYFNDPGCDCPEFAQGDREWIEKIMSAILAKYQSGAAIVSESPPLDELICGWCKTAITSNDAKIGDVSYHHPATFDGPTCYMQAQWKASGLVAFLAPESEEGQ